MQQATPSAGLEQLGAIQTAKAEYTRTAPFGSQEPVWDTFSLTLGQFPSVEAAVDALPVARSEEMAFLEEFWPMVDLSEIILPSGLENTSRTLLSGTIGKRGVTYFYCWSMFQAQDIVGAMFGFSSWYHSTLEVAFVGDMVISRAIGEFSNASIELSSLLPGDDLLTGGLRLAS